MRHLNFRFSNNWDMNIFVPFLWVNINNSLKLCRNGATCVLSGRAFLPLCSLMLSNSVCRESDTCSYGHFVIASQDVTLTGSKHLFSTQH